MNTQDIIDNLKIGADPELFVRNGKELVSAVGLIPGDKKNPHKVKDGAVQLDGMAAEFNIDPASSPEEFVANVSSVMAQLSAMLPKGHSLDAIPVADFGEELINAQPASARELGCDPDFDAYTGQENPTPNVNTPFRTGAGHVHIGWTDGADITDPKHLADCRALALALDITLAIPSLSFDPDNRRRELYGNLGCFRPKPYGMEYRVLSNAWLRDPALVEWVFKQTKFTFERLIRHGFRGVNSYHFHMWQVEQAFKGEDYTRCDILKSLNHQGFIPVPTDVRV